MAKTKKTKVKPKVDPPKCPSGYFWDAELGKCVLNVG